MPEQGSNRWPAGPVAIAVLVVSSTLLPGCTVRPRESGIPMGWRRTPELNAGLPDEIQVYEGSNLDLPLKAWYVRVRERDPDVQTRIVVSDDEDRKESAAEFARRLGAVVVVNGGYFRMDLNPARHVGLLYVDREMLQPATASVRRNTLSYPTTRAALGLGPDGNVDIAWVSSRNDSLFEWEEPAPNREGHPVMAPDAFRARYWKVRDALAAGPSLISDGEIRITSDEEVFFGSSIPAVHPRTAAGYTRNGDLILLVVDGRQPVSHGVDLPELAGLMHDLGCIEAFNLDGGGSSTLVVGGKLVNRPAGGTYQREVMSALAVFIR